MLEKPKTENLNTNLKRLSEIAEWFDKREEVDVEEGLKKVKEAVVLIKSSKQRLKEIENEFETIKKDIDIEDEEKNKISDENSGNGDEMSVKDIPF
jgi:exonuclease VII small subunit